MLVTAAPLCEIAPESKERVAQAMRGDTAVKGKGLSVTDFAAAYMLASYDIGDWRLSERRI